MITIVLLPGMDGTGQLFQPFVAALGSKVTVKVVSYPADGSLGYEELEAIARQQLPTTGCFVILGESFSGPIAISLAASKPPGLVGLILCCSFAKNPRPAFSHMGWLVGGLPVKLAPLAMLSSCLMGRFATPALSSAFRSAYTQASTSALKARLKAVLSCDVTDKLKTINVPLLYLLATHDQVVSASAAKHIAQALPATHIVPIKGPHFLLQVAPVVSAIAVERFMGQVEQLI